MGRRESTLRSWRDRHSRFVPVEHNAEGRASYSLERMQEIEALYGEGLTSREVEAELVRRYGDGDTSGGPVTLARVLDEIRGVREQVDWLVEREKSRDN